MPERIFTDAELKDACRELVNSHGKPDQYAIAERFEVSRQAISARLSKLDVIPAPMLPKIVERSMTSVFNLNDQLERLASRLEKELEGQVFSPDGEGGLSSDLSPMERSSLYGRQIETLKLAKSCLETLYTVNEVKSFQEEVLSLIDSLEPGAKDRIITALRNRRTIRAAFIEPR